MRAYRIAYDGAPYHGFQRQPDVPTVSDAILDALRALDVLDAPADVPTGYAAAGRTDAGVSALAQTIAFEAPEWLTPAALNGDFPASIRAWAVADVGTDFHPTHDATQREYTFYHYAPPQSVHRAALEAAVDRLAGPNDYHNLTPDETGTKRDLEIDVERDECDRFLVIRLSAGGFARQLVRRVVGLLSEVAIETPARESGEQATEAALSVAAAVGRVERVLGDEPLEGPAGVAPAPAHPLVLADVSYEGVTFGTDESAVASARRVFEKRRREQATRAAVAGAIESGLE